MTRDTFWAIVFDSCGDPQGLEDLFLGRAGDDNLTAYIYREAKGSLEDSCDQDEALPELAYRLMWAKGQLEGMLMKLMVAVEARKISGPVRAA